MASTAPRMAMPKRSRRFVRSGGATVMADPFWTLLRLVDLAVLAADQPLLIERGRAEHAAHAHRLHGAAGDEHQSALLLQTFVEHVHGAQVERGRVVLVRLGGLLERMRDFHLGLAQ